MNKQGFQSEYGCRTLSFVSGHDSDALGVAGEAAFRDICSRAKLIVTKTELDRCGWDFRVEWRNSSNERISDNSPPRCAAFVQVKAVFAETSRFSVRLGAASDLVNTLEPSFFVVLIFSRQLELIEIRATSTLGPIASEILRSIRLCTANGADAIDHFKQFGITKWTEGIVNQPDAINAYFLEHIGSDVRDYASAKQAFLKETGFEGAYLSLNAKLFGTPEEIADAFLGDRSILGEIVTAFEERFKIPLPLKDFSPSSGSFEFSPEAHARVKATFKDRATGKKFRFSGLEYRVPAIFAEHFSKIKLDFTYFTLYLVETPNGLGKISFTVRSKDLKSVRANAQGWLEFYRFLDAASRKTLEITVRRIGSPEPALVGSAGADPEIGHTFQTGRAVEILKLLNIVVRDCGIESSELTPDDINDVEHILDCLARAHGKAGPPYVHLEVDSLDDPLTKPRLLMLFTFSFLDQLLTIFVNATSVEYVPGDGRDLFKLENLEYLKSDVTDDYNEIEDISSELASKYDDRDILMLPQGDVWQVKD